MLLLHRFIFHINVLHWIIPKNVVYGIMEWESSHPVLRMFELWDEWPQSKIIAKDESQNVMIFSKGNMQSKVGRESGKAKYSYDITSPYKTHH